MFLIVALNLKIFEHKSYPKCSLRQGMLNQRGLNRWSNNSEQKLGFLSKVKIKKNAFNKK